MRYVMSRILGTDGGSKFRHSRIISQSVCQIKIMLNRQFNICIRLYEPNFHNKIAIYCYFIMKI